MRLRASRRGTQNVFCKRVKTQISRDVFLILSCISYTVLTNKIYL